MPSSSASRAAPAGRRTAGRLLFPRARVATCGPISRAPRRCRGPPGHDLRGFGPAGRRRSDARRFRWRPPRSSADGRCRPAGRGCSARVTGSGAGCWLAVLHPAPTRLCRYVEPVFDNRTHNDVRRNRAVPPRRLRLGRPAHPARRRHRHRPSRRPSRPGRRAHRRRRPGWHGRRSAARAVPGITTRIIDRRGGRLEIGQADGIQSRSVETFQAFGFADRIVDEAFVQTEMVFWKPDPDRPVAHRAHVAHARRPARRQRVPAPAGEPGAGARLLRRVDAATRRRA